MISNIRIRQFEFNFYDIIVTMVVWFVWDPEFWGVCCWPQSISPKKKKWLHKNIMRSRDSNYIYNYQLTIKRKNLIKKNWIKLHDKYEQTNSSITKFFWRQIRVSNCFFDMAVPKIDRKILCGNWHKATFLHLKQLSCISIQSNQIQQWIALCAPNGMHYCP